MKNFEVTFSDGTKIVVQPGSGGSAELFVDKQSFVIYNSGTHEDKNKGELKIAEITEIASFEKNAVSGALETKEIDGMSRYCIICGGRYYCISGGCANTPCGWICG